jgi:predicted RNA binding protein YcfA (HicA-like mRNA interferase family)
MPKLIPCRYSKLRKILLFIGFVQREASGSHVFFGHPDGRTTLVPKRNDDLGKGLLRKILNDAGLTVEEYEKYRQKL